jgi:predicted enzyme related to lactoylglutathione lyase/ketosteroid isomerase-like protein
MRPLRITANLRVDDVEAARSFYAGFLGLSTEEFDMGWVARLTSPDGGTSVQLVTRDATAPEDAVISVLTPDADGAYEEAQRLGYEIVHPLTTERWGVRRFLVRAPDGNVVNVVRHGSPKDLVERWVELFNAGDADALAELYHDDAVNHQVAAEPVEGREAIRDMFRREFASAEMTCIPDVIHEAGDVAILEWTDPLGLRGCGFFTVREGRIALQRGYWDKLSFLRLHGLPIPPD